MGGVQSTHPSSNESIAEQRDAQVNYSWPSVAAPVHADDDLEYEVNETNPTPAVEEKSSDDDVSKIETFMHNWVVASPFCLSSPRKLHEHHYLTYITSKLQERESFQGWRSTPPSSQPRSSVDSPRPHHHHQQHHPPGPPSRDSLMSKPSSNDASSSGWIGERPSTDTPLHHNSNSLGSGGGAGKHASHQQHTNQNTTSTNATPLASQQTSPPPSALPVGRHSSTSVGGESSITTISAGASARTSFAIERASLEANRISVEAFRGAYNHQHHQSQAANSSSGGGGEAVQDQQAYAALEEAEDAVTLEVLVALAGLPPHLKDEYAALCVLPPQTPAPATCIAMLWQTSDHAHVLQTLQLFAAKGILSIARLPTGHIWALPQMQHLHLVQAACKNEAAEYHTRLVKAYIAQGGVVRQQCTAALSLASVKDDGYFVANIIHHLMGGNHLDIVKALLFDPGWLERKLKACGAAAVVADFRRYLLVQSDRTAKVVLEAFQMSVGLVQAHPEVAGLLRCLIPGRLMTVPLPSEMKVWMQQQRAIARAEGAAAVAAKRPRTLLPLTPSLDQAGGLQRLALKGHRGAVTKIMLTPSGTEALSAGADGTVRLWDLEIGDSILVMEGHTAAITDMVLTADGSLLISASEDGTARACELENGQCLRVLAGHEGSISAVVVDPSGRFVATGGVDGTVRVWDLASARVLHMLDAPGGANAMDLSPCTRYLIVGCGDGAVRIFDIVSGQAIGVLMGHTRGVFSVLFTADGKRAVSASLDGTLRTWSVRSGRCVAVMMEGHSGRINSLALSLDGKIAATGGEDGTACVWDVKTGSCLRKLQGHVSWLSHVALSPACDRIITTSGDGTAIAWDLSSGEIFKVLEGHSGAVLSAAVTRRGRFAVTASDDGSVRVWDFSASSTHTPKWHEGRIRALAARDGLLVATAGDDCVARLWNSALGEYRGLFNSHEVPIRWAQFSEDGTRLVTASPDRRVCVWDCATLELLHSLPVHKGSRMKSFSVSGDLSTAVVCLFDSTVTVWDLAAGEATVAVQKWGQRDEATGHTSAVNQVLLTQDGTLVVTLSKDSTTRVWDAATGRCLHVLRGHTDSVSGGCLSSDGTMVATHSYDGTIRLWSLVSGGSSLAVVSVKSAVTKMALSQCGWKVAAALADGSVSLFDFTATVEEHHSQDDDDNVLVLEEKKGEDDVKTRAVGVEVSHVVLVSGEKEEIADLCFSGDGASVITCSIQGTARVIDAATGELSGVFVSDCGLTCCHYDSVTECIVAGTDRGVVHFIDASL